MKSKSSEAREANAQHGDERPQPKSDQNAELRLEMGQASLAIGARVIAGFEYELTELDETEAAAGLRSHEFGWDVSQARLTLDGSYGKAVELQLDLDFSDANSPIRDAWLNYRVVRAFQLRVGRFKRPFSRLELKSAGKLPIRSRGLANDHIVSDLGYGERSVGGQLWGRIKSRRLEWFLSFSNPPPGFDGADLHARLVYEPVPSVEFGLAGVHKIQENNLTAQADYIAGNGAGLDMRLSTSKFELLLDALVGENLGALGLLEPDARAVRNYSASLGGMATYEFDLPGDWELQPVAFAEWVDSNLEYGRSEAVRVVAGLNGLWRKDRFRVLPQVELIEPLDPNSETIWPSRQTFYVMFSGQI